MFSLLQKKVVPMSTFLKTDGQLKFPQNPFANTVAYASIAKNPDHRIIQKNLWYLHITTTMLIQAQLWSLSIL